MENKQKKIIAINLRDYVPLKTKHTFKDIDLFASNINQSLFFLSTFI